MCKCEVIFRARLNLRSSNTVIKTYALLLQIALRFVEESEESSPVDVLLIKRWRAITAKKRCGGKKSSN
jgi:hypothetical protein